MLESRSPVQVAIVLTVLHLSKTSIHLVGVLSIGKHHYSLCSGRTHESSSLKRNFPTDSLIRLPTTSDSTASAFSSTFNKFCARTVLLQTASPYFTRQLKYIYCWTVVANGHICLRGRERCWSWNQWSPEAAVVDCNIWINKRMPPDLSYCWGEREIKQIFLFAHVAVVCCSCNIYTSNESTSVCVCIRVPSPESIAVGRWWWRNSGPEVNMLMGSDFYWKLGRVIRGTHGPVANQTKLSWVLSGPALPEKLSQCSTNLVITHVLKIDAQTLSNESWNQMHSRDLESLGIVGEDRTLYDEFINTITIKDGKYEVVLHVP